MIGYAFTRRAEKQFLCLPRNIQHKILEKLEFFLGSDNPLTFARRLSVPGAVYRFRIDDYRVILEWKGEEILILKVGHRSDIYRQS